MNFGWNFVNHGLNIVLDLFYYLKKNIFVKDIVPKSFI